MCFAPLQAVTSINTLLEKADRLYRQLQQQRPQLESLLVRVSERSVHQQVRAASIVLSYTYMYMLRYMYKLYTVNCMFAGRDDSHCIIGHVACHWRGGDVRRRGCCRWWWCWYGEQGDQSAGAALLRGLPQLVR